MATYSVQRPPFQVTRLRRSVFIIPAILGLLLLGGLFWLLASPKARDEVAKIQDAGNWPGWLKQATAYTPTKQATAPTTVERDLVAEELAKIRQQLLEQQRALEELKRRPVPQPVKAPEPAKPVEKKKPQSMLFIAHKGDETKPEGEPTYTVMPGYYVPCIIETSMNSDTGDITFVAATTSTVYDTETGRYPLILQGSKIVGEGQGAALLYGNERLRTVSLTLSRRQDKTPIDLGSAPVTDQAGVNGLVSRVDQHYWRLLGAVFIGGALRGGMQALQTSIAGASGAEQIVVGVGQTGTQAVTRATSRALDTRPTIEVDAGQLCHVILTKPLTLTVAR